MVHSMTCIIKHKKYNYTILITIHTTKVFSFMNNNKLK